jgi:hypothetical protein
MVHKTPTGERIKQLRTDVRKLGAALSAARELADVEELGDGAGASGGRLAE